MKQIYVFDRHEVTIFETHIYSYFVLFKPTTHYHYFFIGYNLQNFEKKEIIFRKPGLQIITLRLIIIIIWMRKSTAGGLSLYYLGDTLICTLWGLMQLLLKCILFKIKNNAKHVNATLLILQPKKIINESMC
jgi:hypothetical protein